MVTKRGHTAIALSWLLTIAPALCFLALVCAKLVFITWLIPGEYWDWVLDESVGRWIRAPSHVFSALRQHPYVVSTTLASLMIPSALLLLFPRVWTLSLLILLDLLLTTVGLADALYIRFYGELSSVLDVSASNMLPTVYRSVLRLLDPTDAMYYVDILAGLIAFPIYVRASRRTSQPSRAAILRLSMILFSASLLLLLPATRVVWQDENGAFAFTSLRRKVASTVGILPYHLLDATISPNAGDSDIGEPEIERVRHALDKKRRHETAPSKLFGIGRGYNVIVISAESLQAFPIGLKIDGQLVTPYLSAFAGESLYFSHFYEQAYLGTTADAQFAVLNSLHPLATTRVVHEYPSNRYRALPVVLSEHGYATMSAVPVGHGFWNWDKVFPSYGFRNMF